MMQRQWVLSLLALLLFLTATILLAQDERQPGDADKRVFLPAILTNGQTTTATGEETNDDSTDGLHAPTLIVRIYFQSRDQLHELTHRVDLIEESTSNGYAAAVVSAGELEQLHTDGYRVEIDQTRTDALNAALAQMQQAAAAEVPAAGIPGFACYRTVEETYTTLAAFVATHPNLATWTDIGNSWEKVMPGGQSGYDLFALTLTNKSRPGPKPKFFLMAAIHAREYTTAELATRFAEELVSKYNVDPDVTWLLDYFELHLVAQANPDGRKLAEGGQLWRKNTDNDDGCNSSSTWGVDLNRNSSYRWNMGGSSPFACNLTYHGPEAASEPETQAIEAYSRAIFPDQRGPNDNDPAPADAEGVFITLHSYSELVLFPWGWTTQPAPNLTQLETLGRKFGFYNGYDVCNGPTCLYGTSGTTDDYTYGELGVASYTIELGQNFFEQCSFFENNILPKNMPALYYAFKSARRPYQTPAGPDVYDLALSAATSVAGAQVNLSGTVDDTRYNSNGWGTEPTQTIQAARYTLDAPSWSGAAVYPLAATDGAFSSKVETVVGAIDTTGLAPGRHLIFVESQDAEGNWGAPTAIFLTISGQNPTVTPTPTATATAIPTSTPTATPIPTANEVIYLSLATGGSVGGVTFDNSDILALDRHTNQWSLYFDGSDVGLWVNLDAFTRLPTGALLLSVDVATTLPMVGLIDDADIVKFTPTSLGETTAGVFSLYLDASDVGLSANSEDIDGIGVTTDGRLLVSTVGSASVPGVAGADEDLLAFSATSFGDVTTGFWSLYFDGSDVGLGDWASEDIQSVWVDPTNGKIYLTTTGAFAVNGVNNSSGNAIFVCTPSALGDITACTFGPGLYWEGAVFGVGGNFIDGLAIFKD